MIHLVVNEPFENFKRGALVTDPVEVERILSGENRHDVVQRAASADHERFFKSDDELAGRVAVAPVASPAPAARASVKVEG